MRRDVGVGVSVGVGDPGLGLRERRTVVPDDAQWSLRIRALTPQLRAPGSQSARFARFAYAYAYAYAGPGADA